VLESGGQGGFNEIITASKEDHSAIISTRNCYNNVIFHHRHERATVSHQGDAQSRQLLAYRKEESKEEQTQPQSTAKEDINAITSVRNQPTPKRKEAQYLCKYPFNQCTFYNFGILSIRPINW